MQVPGTLTSVYFTGTVKLQLSAAVKMLGILSSEQAATVSEGVKFHRGATLSITVIFCITLLVFPQTSVAVHVFSRVKFCGQDPIVLFSDLVILTIPLQLSVTVGRNSSTGSVHDKFRSTGVLVNTGFSLSCTLIVCVFSVLFPHLSRLVHFLNRT